MGLLDKIAELSQDEIEATDLSFEAFSRAMDTPTTCRKTLTDSEMARLKKEVGEIRQQIMQGTFEQTTAKMRTIVAWFRATREEGFTLIQEKVKKEKKPKTVKEPKTKRVSKKAAEAAALSKSLEDLL